MIKGYADLENTKKYLKKNAIKKVSTNSIYSLSSIGCGTYLGFPSKLVDLEYKNAIQYAISKGINIIDTAINYRGMRSESVVGAAIKELINEEKINRSDVVIATKGGFLPTDYRNVEVEENYQDTIVAKVSEYFKKEIVPYINYNEDKIHSILNRRNAVENEVIQCLFEESRKNLGIETIDIYYLHNPENSKMVLGEEVFYEELYKTFLLLEQKVQEGHLKYYGISTYGGFIVDSKNPRHLSLEKIMQIAQQTGGIKNHFKFIQLPFNKTMRDAETLNTQRLEDKFFTPLEAAKKLGINVMTNISLGQGKSFNEYGFEEMISYLIENEKVCSSMIGMKKLSNVEKNIKALL